MNPLITVVIPVYNVEKYLKKCLDSILSQTYSNLEIILVDDGSTDNSGEICDNYAEQHKNILVIHKKNAGLGMARNSGIDRAKGEYIFFLDSDDYIDANEIDFQYNLIKKYGVEACYVGYTAVDEDGEFLYTHAYRDEVFNGEDAKNRLLPKMLGSPDGSYNDRIEMGACPLVYSMKPIKKHGIRFVSERNLISEDFIFNIDYLEVADGACTSSNTGCYYRQNNTSLSHRYKPDRFEKFKDFYEYVDNRLKGFNFSEVDRNRYDKTFLIQIRGVICAEFSKECGKKFKERMRRIKEICSDPLVHKVACNYPVKNMGKTHRLYVSLLRKEKYIILSLILFVWTKFK